MARINDTIAAISTPIGEGGIGIVRISGKKALSISDKIFKSKSGRKPSGLKTYTLHYGHIVSSSKRKPSEAAGEIIDEVLLTVMRAPKSYTKEDVVEINCHGGIVPLRRVFEEVVACGARPAEPGEFTKRAFLNGRIDLAQAESVIDIIKAKTESSLRVAIGHLEGDFSKSIGREREKLIALLERLEARIDFEEETAGSSKDGFLEEIAGSEERVSRILDTKDLGALLKEGITCVICGKTNVGKSSLLNALLRRQRAIVTHIPGTTRDAIEETVSVRGIPVRLVDTAGIIKADSIVDEISVGKTKEYLKKADLVIFVLDLASPFNREDKRILKLLPKGATVAVANKCDARQRLNIDELPGWISRDILKISVLKKKNIDKLEKVVSEKILSGKIMHPEPALLTNARHASQLKSAFKNIKSAEAALKKEMSFEYAALDVKKAIFELGLIIGKSVDIDILDRIFKDFCIGK